MLEPSIEKMTFILLLRDSSTTIGFLTSVPHTMFANTNVWLVMSKNARLGKVFLPVDSQVFTFQSSQTEINIKETYNIDIGMEQTVHEFGSWRIDKNSSLLEINPLPIFERRKDMEGLLFLGETKVEPPFIIGDDEDIINGKQKFLK